jgi:DNA mismatch endonuclease, patch repair protein
MADYVTREIRSRVMSKVRSSGNRATELQLVAIFRTKKIRGWRRRYKLAGKPDFVFLKSRVAVFVDGCFWHSCPQHCRMPSSNQSYWNEKINRNKRRDHQITRRLRRDGWRVVRIWEHELRKPARCLGRICRVIKAK